jgi:hypothetical protein
MQRPAPVQQQMTTEMTRSGSMDKLVNLQFQEKRALIASSFRSEMICNQLKADQLAYGKGDLVATAAAGELSAGRGDTLKGDAAYLTAASQLPALRNANWKDCQLCDRKILEPC